MNGMKTESQIRYSPQLIGAYGKHVHGFDIGPGSSTMLQAPAAWNLAYLSHDYEAEPEHKDPTFNVLVSQTSRWFLTGGSFDLTGTGVEFTIGRWLLSLPAPRFVFMVKNHRVLPELPLFKRYGQAWLDTIDARSHLCTTQDPDNVVDVPSVTDAVIYLAKHQLKGTQNGGS